MNDSKTDKLVCVAAIAGAFGVNGAVKLKTFTSAPENCAAYGPLLDETGTIVLTPTQPRVMKNFLVISAVEISTPEAANALKSTKLYVPRSALPQPDEDDFYYEDLIGLDVKTTSGQRIGRITAVHQFGAGDMLEIKPVKDKKTGKQSASFYHPFTKAAVPKIDIASKRLIIHIEAAETA